MRLALVVLVLFAGCSREPQAANRWEYHTSGPFIWRVDRVTGETWKNHAGGISGWERVDDPARR